MKQISKKYNSGFSIMILIIGAVVIGIIVALAIFGYNAITKKTGSAEQTDKTNTAATQVSQEWVTVGTQKWSNINLNVGTMITSDKNQTDNSILEKYCYDNLESNCTSHGGALYQWDEAMQYVNTEGAQGICPAGSHIPTDNDWKILEVQLGMSQVQAGHTGMRGTDQGTKLQAGGLSGLDVPLAGYSDNDDGSFSPLSSYASLWSSSESSSTSAWPWERSLVLGGATVGRDTYDKVYGFSVRCLEN